MTNNRLSGLTAEETIRRVVAGCVERREWRTSAEKAASAYLTREERARRGDVVAYVREIYDAAGAGFAGRWQ